VERVNKEIMRHLRALVFDKKTYKYWSDNLPIVQRIINTSMHESIGISPAQLLLGNAVTLDTEMFVPQSQRSSAVPLSEWAAQRLKQQELLLSRAKLTQQKQDKANLTKRTEKRKLLAEPKPQSKLPAGPSDSTETRQSKRLPNSTKTVSDDFQPGDLVLASYPDSSLGKGRPPHKLMMPLRGPYAVVSKHRGSYLLRELTSNKESEFNAHLLRPYIHNAKQDNPYEVSLKETQSHDVESILRHKGNPRRVSTLTFEVKWVGESKTSWEPWKGLRGNSELHSYLTSKGLQRLISTRFSPEDD
jgi:hypothetical protein